MSTNAIKNIKTQMYTRRDGQQEPVLVIGLDIFDADAADSFVKSVVEQFKLQRMASPPETALMLISVFGAISLKEFKLLWTKHADADPIARAFMSSMKSANAITGTDFGKISEEVSLIAADKAT